MNIIYFGANEWGFECLKEIFKSHNILLAVGRYNAYDNISDFCDKNQIVYKEYENINSDQAIYDIKKLNADLLVSVAYNQILSANILNSAGIMAINLHAGMLPKYRGNNPINWAIINGENEVGITIHKMEARVDTGEILLQKAVKVEFTDDYGSVLKKVLTVCPKLLFEALRMIETGNYKLKRFYPKDGFYMPRRANGDEMIDWNDISLNIYNKIRAISHPGPGAYSFIGNRRFMIWTAEFIDSPRFICTTGQVLEKIKNVGCLVKTQDTQILIKKIQFENEEEKTCDFSYGIKLGINLYEEVARIISINKGR